MVENQAKAKPGTSWKDRAKMGGVCVPYTIWWTVHMAISVACLFSQHLTSNRRSYRMCIKYEKHFQKMYRDVGMAVPKTTETRCRDGSVQGRHVIQRLHN